MDSSRAHPRQLEIAQGWRQPDRADRVTDEIENNLGTMSVRRRERSAEHDARLTEHSVQEYSLFYRPPGSKSGQIFPVIENFADPGHLPTPLGYEIGVFRSTAEAKIVGTFLMSPIDPDATLTAAGYVQEDPRRWRHQHARWSDGYSSVFLGSDEDKEDVSVDHRPNGEGAAFCPFYLGRHGQKDSRPAPSRTRQADLAAAAVFLHLIEQTGHLRQPLDHTDWDRWASGQPILALAGPIDTGPPRDLAFVVLTQELGNKAKKPEKFYALNRLIADIKGADLPSDALLADALEAFDRFAAVVPDWPGLPGLRQSLGPRGDGAAHFVYSEHQARVALIGLTQGLGTVRRLVEEVIPPRGPRPS